MNPAGPHPHPSGHPDDERGPRPAAGLTDPTPNPSPAERRRAAAVAGHTGDLDTARTLLDDPDASVRATALGALVRAGHLDVPTVHAAATDPDPGVRRRVAEELGRHRPAGVDPDASVRVLVDLLGDPDPLTAEAAAWAIGEVATSGGDAEPLAGAVDAPIPASTPVVAALVDATGHDDPLVREAAVAALGAVGHPTGLPAVLSATTDRPAIRRRAVLALAAFLGEPGVDEALGRALADRDWQVRQAAELLRRPDP